MSSAFSITLAILFILGGTAMFAFPRAVSSFQEDAETTPEQAMRQVRVGGGFLFIFGWALLYAVLNANGPAEFIGV